jgi:hypothetical protein
VVKLTVNEESEPESESEFVNIFPLSSHRFSGQILSKDNLCDRDDTRDARLLIMRWNILYLQRASF